MSILQRFTLDGSVAVITGAGRGIGRAIALAYAENGADVVCAARTLADVEAVADEVRALGRRAIAVSCDVTDLAQREALVASAREQFGRITHLVNNAGGAVGAEMALGVAGGARGDVDDVAATRLAHGGHA